MVLSAYAGRNNGASCGSWTQDAVLARMRRRIGFSLGCFGCLLLAACSTVDSRIKERPAVYSALSRRDQALVRSGTIREGLSKDAVYIAWGAPAQVRSGSRNGHPYELGSIPLKERSLPAMSTRTFTGSAHIGTKATGTIRFGDLTVTLTDKTLFHMRFPTKRHFLKPTVVLALSPAGNNQ